VEVYSVISIKINANLLSIYAAIISTLVFIIQLLNYINNRVNIELSYKKNYKVEGGNYDSNKTYLILTVRNKGKRPVTIQKVGYLSKKDFQHGIFIDSLIKGPRELLEGKSIDYIVDQEEVDFDKINCFVAYDQVGREYKCKL
jgi:hypothetical protein